MRKLFVWGLLLLLVACSTEEKTDAPDGDGVFENSASDTAEAKPELPDFSVLEGDWEKRGAYAVVSESWKKLDTDYWQGQVVRVEGKDSTLLESLQLEPRGDSTYVYIARVYSQNEGKAIPYTLASHEPGRYFEFHNAGHDFPQRIVYELPDAQTLRITLGILADTTKNKVFTFQKRR